MALQKDLTLKLRLSQIYPLTGCSPTGELHITVKPCKKQIYTQIGHEYCKESQ